MNSYSVVVFFSFPVTILGRVVISKLNKIQIGLHINQYKTTHNVNCENTKKVFGLLPQDCLGNQAKAYSNLSPIYLFKLSMENEKKSQYNFRICLLYIS